MARSNVRIREGFRLGLAHLGYAAIAFVFLLPLWWAVVSSLRPNGSVFADVFPFTAKALAPSPATLEAYEGVVQAGFGWIILNTLLVAAITTVAGLILNAAAGFAFAIFDFRGKRIILSLVILSFMLPFEAIALPLYNVMRQLGWLDSIAALVVPGVTNGLVVFLFYQFFRQIPRDYVEAARLDGVSWPNIMLRIYVPLIPSDLRQRRTASVCLPMGGVSVAAARDAVAGLQGHPGGNGGVPATIWHDLESALRRRCRDGADPDRAPAPAAALLRSRTSRGRHKGVSRSMAELKLKEVSKSFGSVEVVRHVNLSVDDGEFVVFVGPSGCGKSTLLRMIAGLEKVGGGEIRIGARDVTDLDPSERGVAMVFQSYALYPHMSVEENIGFGLRMNGMSKSDVRGKVAEAASILHLEDLLKRKPRELSGGQRQRVAIGRAIVRKPEVFLFDEPLSNLDAELRVQMRLEITKLHQAMGATMIYVTHDQTEAMTLADKIVVLRSGRVEQVGTPLEVYDNPDNAFVAGFIGSPKMNFLPAVGAGARDGRFMVRLTDFDNVDVPFALPNAPAGLEFLVGVRPEHFARDGEVRLGVTLDVVEHLGGTSFGYARSDSERPLTIELRDRRGIETGARIELGFDAARALLFDRATGERLR